MHQPHPVCFFVPPYVTAHATRAAVAAGRVPPEGRSANTRNAAVSDQFRSTRRRTVLPLEQLAQPRPGKGDRIIFDDKHQWNTDVAPAVRGEGDAPAKDASANRAYDSLGATKRFYAEILNRDSIDGNGLQLDGNVNFGVDYDNAFWDGQRMVFGNGDNQIFKDFTLDLDVAGHELTHGVTQYTAGLQYDGQPGALNEATSDIMGTSIEQFTQGTDAGTSNWLIGEDVMADDLAGEAIRSMKAPGTAFDNPLMGKDPQPASMAGYYNGPSDNHGVHINSGIINRAFYLMSTDLGTLNAARIWYATLQNLWPTADFAGAASVCASMAGLLARGGTVPRQAAQSVRSAFREVGVIA